MDERLHEITVRVSKKAADIYSDAKSPRRSLDHIISRWLESHTDQVEEFMRLKARGPIESEKWAVEVPVHPEQADSATITGSVHLDPSELMQVKDDHTIIEPWVSVAKEDEPAVKWLSSCEALLIRIDAAEKIMRIVRPATREEARQWRVPLWIQGPEVPECCGFLMHFVGQIDDDKIWEEPPPAAVLWWHDTASFYVFTCPICLGVKAVGQQC